MDARLADAVFAAPAAPALGGPGPVAPAAAEPRPRTARARVTSEAVGVRGGLGGYYRSLPPWIDDITKEFGPDTYERMQLDDQVSSSLRALCHGVLSDELVLRPAVDDRKDPDFAAAKDALGFCERATWGQTGGLDSWLLAMLKGAVGGGNRVSETVYRPGESGRDAGRWVLGRLKVKPRRSIAFAVDSCNNLAGILGLPPGGTSWGGLAWGTAFDPADPPDNFLPRDKFCVLTWDPPDEDPRGSAVLRCVYEPWWAKLQAAREWLAYLAQFGSPSLVGTTAPGADSTQPTDAYGNPTADPVLTPEQDMANQVLALRNGGVFILPSGATLEILQTSNAGDAFLKKVDSSDRAIAQGVLLAMRAVMQSRFGSRADAEQGQDVAGLQTRFMKRWLARMVTEDLLRPLVRINFGPDAARRLCPYASLSPVEHQDLGTALVAMTGAWKAGFLKESQLAWAYEQFGMPPALPEELKPPAPPQAPGAPPAPGGPPPAAGRPAPGGPDEGGGRDPLAQALLGRGPPGAAGGKPQPPPLPPGAAPFAFNPEEAREPAGSEGGGRWTSGGAGAGGIAGKPKRSRLRDQPGVTPLHLADHIADLADSHFRNMRAIMKGLLDGNYAPKDAVADVDHYRDGALRANHARHVKFEARLGDKLEEAYGAAAMDSPQWNAVLAAVESSEAEAGTHVEDMADAVRNLAAYYVAHPGETVRIRKGTDDADRVGEIHDDMVTAAHAEFHKIFDAVDAFKAAHKPMAGFAAFAFNPGQSRGQPENAGQFGPGGGGAAQAAPAAQAPAAPAAPQDDSPWGRRQAGRDARRAAAEQAPAGAWDTSRVGATRKELEDDPSAEKARGHALLYAELWRGQEAELQKAGATEAELGRVAKARAAGEAAAAKRLGTFAAAHAKHREAAAALARAEGGEPPEPGPGDYPPEPEEPAEPEGADPAAHARWEQEHDKWEGAHDRWEAAYAKVDEDFAREHDRWEAQADKAQEKADAAGEKAGDALEALTDALDEHDEKFQAAVDRASEAVTARLDAEEEADPEPEEPEAGFAFDPGQPRVPAGSAEGGEWGSGGGGAATAEKPPGKKPRVDVGLTDREEATITRIVKGPLKIKGGLTPEQLAALGGAPPDGQATVRPGADKKSLVIHVSNDFTAVRHLRRLGSGELIMENESIHVKESEQGKGLGTEVFARQVDAARALGVGSIRCHAARYDAQGREAFNGYSTWPKLGYDQDLEDLEDQGDGDLAGRARAEFPGVESILQLMAVPGGKHWWAKNGTDLHKAKFDLADGSDSMLVLGAYLDARKEDAARG